MQIKPIMANIINFPSLSDREWRVWEESIRENYTESILDPKVLADAIPRIKAHWTGIFQDLTLELPQRRVPGELTEEQAIAIQEIIDASAQLVVNRLKSERAEALGRLIKVEILLSQSRVGN